VITDGMATRRRIEEVRCAAQLSMGSDGPVTLPRDSSETLTVLLSRGLLCADRDDQLTGRALVYRPTPRLRQFLGGGDARRGKRQARRYRMTTESEARVEHVDWVAAALPLKPIRLSLLK
jgi:hypothetical protein